MFSQDFKEFLQSLNGNQVRYLVIGGYAVAFHGHPRFTKDLDVWIEISPVNADRAVTAVAEFGFSSLNLTRDDFLDANQVIQMGFPPYRIDLIMAPDGVDFATCYDARVEVDMQGIKVPFIDLVNLRRNKQASGRHQDLADLENLAE